MKSTHPHTHITIYIFSVSFIRFKYLKKNDNTNRQLLNIAPSRRIITTRERPLLLLTNHIIKISPVLPLRKKIYHIMVLRHQKCYFKFKKIKEINNIEWWWYNLYLVSDWLKPSDECILRKEHKDRSTNSHQVDKKTKT